MQPRPPQKSKNKTISISKKSHQTNLFINFIKKFYFHLPKFGNFVALLTHPKLSPRNIRIEIAAQTSAVIGRPCFSFFSLAWRKFDSFLNIYIHERYRSHIASCLFPPRNLRPTSLISHCYIRRTPSEHCGDGRSQIAHINTAHREKVMSQMVGKYLWRRGREGGLGMQVGPFTRSLLIRPSWGQ